MDTTETIQGSLIQHGKGNNRIYLMHYASDDPVRLIMALNQLAEQNQYSKIFAKIPETHRQVFMDHGYLPEGAIPGFFKGREQVFFMSRFLNAQRVSDPHIQTVEQICNECMSVSARSERPDPGEGFTFKPAEKSDIPALVDLYKEVFRTYPFPIHDPDYIARTMDSHIHYSLILKDGALVAASSAEMDREESNAELTDFATRPDFRGRGLASCLLYQMEQQMRDEGIQTVYTIARALSKGMNRTFARAGYHFGGTLINNTNICGAIESMNIWYRPVSE
ncbi:MAG: putative beta-lysine N-acetyltransferase [Spartobacteria bacterium]|nr:putative beta-lysine N-acetyltransferase [Spartobacteria bacterium]